MANTKQAKKRAAQNVKQKVRNRAVKTQTRRVVKATRHGRFALIVPVMTSTEGRCVARIRWMPMARAFCASRATDSSISRGAVIIRSASSSMTMTM